MLTWKNSYKMHRDYDTGASDSVTLFVGEEVEHTPVYKEQTLFVVGYDYDPAYLQILCSQYNCNHVYLGANHSFDGNNLKEWTMLAKSLLEHDLYVTLDFDVKFVEDVTELCLAEYDRFIPMISVKIPYADQLGYNACVKVDDKDFRASNHGVWVHRLRRLMSERVFTPWSKYTQDTVIK